jgi:hypothetical protein
LITSSRIAFYQQPGSSRRLTSCRFALLIMALVLSSAAVAQSAGPYETPPSLPPDDLAPASLVQGAGFNVKNPVSTDGLMAHFVLRSNVGVFQAPGLDLLRIRVAELPAIFQLQQTSKTGVFAQSLASNAMRPVHAAGKMISNPMETVQGMPGGVQRFFGRVGHGAQQLAEAATNSGENGGGAEMASRIGKTTADVLGYEQERRELAKKLHVDPYTTNPVLVPLLDQIAQVAFAGHVGVTVAFSVAVPGSMAITGTTMVSNWVYDTPKADLIVRDQNKLKELGVSNETIQALNNNIAFPLSVQTEFVQSLGQLSGVPGCVRVAELASSAESEVQARFLTDAVGMLVTLNRRTPLARLSATRTVVGFGRDGSVLVPAPVDYVSWTRRIATFATRPDLAARKKVALLTGQMSPMAKRHFRALGWIIYERVPLRSES